MDIHSVCLGEWIERTYSSTLRRASKRTAKGVTSMVVGVYPSCPWIVRCSSVAEQAGRMRSRSSKLSQNDGERCLRLMVSSKDAIPCANRKLTAASMSDQYISSNLRRCRWNDAPNQLLTRTVSPLMRLFVLDCRRWQYAALVNLAFWVFSSSDLFCNLNGR